MTLKMKLWKERREKATVGTEESRGVLASRTAKLQEKGKNAEGERKMRNN